MAEFTVKVRPEVKTSKGGKHYKVAMVEERGIGNRESAITVWEGSALFDADEALLSI